jgi:murein L,D-transpeptidase YcbB/YkuD
MHIVRHDRVLAATLALLLSSAGTVWAMPDNSASSESPKSETAPLTAPSKVTSPGPSDPAIGAVRSSNTAAAQPADADINARIPLPAPLDLPPPSAMDVAAPAPAPVPEKAIAPATVQAPPAAVTPPTNVAGAEDPVAGKLRDLLTAKVNRFIDRPRDKSAAESFYAARQYAPLWTEKGVATDRAKATIAYLAGVAAEGLDPADYPTPDFQTITDPAALAQAELKMTNVVLTYARHAQIGRVHFTRVSEDIFYTQVLPEPADILAKMADAKNTSEALASYNPPQEGYKALKAKLAEVRARTTDAGPQRIGTGPLVKVGMDDPRVPLVRSRLGVAGDVNNTTYDKALFAAVKKFQRQRDLNDTGNLNSATIDALNGPRRDRDADIIVANMERWRWMPRDLGKTYVMLNVPDYSLKVVNNGKMVWTTRVVVGKTGKMATPVLSETMKYITVNPTWNVPPSIINNEYLPALQQDPNALERIGLKLVQDSDGDIRIYQPPGDGNALGRLRFNFPNKFLVYQHDTPDKHLFALDKRAFSHGCMRVQYPDKYAEVLLGISQPNEGWTVDKLHSMYGNTEQNINLATPIPVHITYQTAFVDDGGHLQIRDDVYGRDAALLAIMRGSERRVADIAIERKETTTTVRKDIQLPDSAFMAGGGRPPRYASQTSFFEMLFGGGFAPPQPPAPVNRRRYYDR